MLLEGKKLLVTGVLTRESIACRGGLAPGTGSRARADVVRPREGLTEKSARRLPRPVDVLEMDANDPQHIEAISNEIGCGGIGSTGSCTRSRSRPRTRSAATSSTRRGRAPAAIQTSAYSLKAIAAGMLPHMREHGSIVSLDFDARVAWLIYDWMGVAKASPRRSRWYSPATSGRTASV